MRPAWSFVLAAVACGAPSAPAPTALPADGEILERGPCPTPTDADAFAAEIDDYFREDLITAGLEAELEAQPLGEIYPPSDFDRLVEASTSGRCERVVYRSEGLRVVGFVVHPVNPEPHPVVIWLRGGNRDYGKNGTQALLTMLDLADAGFVVLAPQYRGVDGGEGKDEFGGADVADVLALEPMARRLPDADPARLYVIGGSRGAMQGLIALRRGLRVRAAAWRGGMFDAVRALVDRPDLAEPWGEIIPGFDTDRDAALAARSALQWADEVRVPTLLVHGRQDWRVDLDQAEDFAAALAAAEIEHELVVYERDEHQLVLHRDAWIARVVAWFRAH